MRTVYLIALLSLFNLCLPLFAFAGKVSREYPAGPITVNNSDGKVTITYTKEGKSYTDTFECKGASSIKVDTVGDKTYVKMVCE